VDISGFKDVAAAVVSASASGVDLAMALKVTRTDCLKRSSLVT
jgi:hypothetical protein